MKNFFFLLLFIPCISFPQTDLQYLIDKANALEHEKVDSAVFYYHLVDSLAIIREDHYARKEALSFLAYYYVMRGTLDPAISAYEALLLLVEEPEEKVQTFFGYAITLEDRNYEKADSLYLLGIQIAEQSKMKGEMGGLYGNYATFLGNNGYLTKAIQYYQKGIEVVQHPLPKMSLMASLAGLFILTENDKRAGEYVQKAITIGEENNYKSRNGPVAVVYAKWLLHQDRFEEAQQELDKAIPYLKNRNDKAQLGLAIMRQIELYMAQGKWEEAEAVMDEVEQMKPELPEMQLAIALRMKGWIYHHHKDYERQIEVAHEALELTKKITHPFYRKQAHYQLSKAYAANGEKDKAYDHLVVYEMLSDSLYRKGQAQLTSELEAEFKRKEQDQQIALLDAQNATKEARLSFQRKIIIYGAVGLGLISLLSFLLFQLYRRIDKQKGQISKALREKEILLREIHHRVKNNLQLVSSLLTLQSRSITDPNAVIAINEGKSRVRSMALIHQDLYSRDNLTGINVGAYLEKLCSELFATYDISQEKVQLHLNIQDINLDIDTIVPLGLIINELISNALKYAFPNDESGNLWINLAEINDHLVLSIKDDGVGFDPGKVNQQSFGHTLITALTDQLEGRLNRESSDGTLVSIQFSDYKKVA